MRRGWERPHPASLGRCLCSLRGRLRVTILIAGVLFFRVILTPALRESLPYSSIRLCSFRALIEGASAVSIHGGAGNFGKRERGSK